MKAERVRDTVGIDLERWRLTPKSVAVYRRRIWSPDKQHWVTDFGVEILRVTLWVHLPWIDDCCRKGHDPY